MKNVVEKGIGISLELTRRHWMKFSSSEGEQAASRDGSKRTRRARSDALEHDIVYKFLAKSFWFHQILY